jgi:hypothetical protein
VARVVPDDGGEAREYSLPRGVHVNVQEGDRSFARRRCALSCHRYFSAPYHAAGYPMSINAPTEIVVIGPDGGEVIISPAITVELEQAAPGTADCAGRRSGVSEPNIEVSL